MYVYWIHLDNMMLSTDGYVGVSNNPHKRFYQHQQNARLGKKDHLCNAINKYTDLCFTIISEGTKQECLEFEKFLRPACDIGWNITTGGGFPPAHKKHTEEAKSKISEALKTRIVSQKVINRCVQMNKEKRYLRELKQALCKPVKCIETGIIYKYGATEAYEITGINRKSITDVTNGKRKTAGGFRWEKLTYISN